MKKEIDFFYFMGYYGILYLVVLACNILFFPISEQFIRPIAAFIFPIAGSNSLLKTLLITSGFYWGGVLFNIYVIQKAKIKF
ncbi:MAG: hypothetical protein AAGI66_05970 [Cyanobacteria bacterium P01_H01_bin.74]